MDDTRSSTVEHARIADRKGDHLKVCLERDVEAVSKNRSLDRVRLWPKALPDLDWSDLKTDSEIFGRVFRWPILIPGMTGGVELGETINRRLAEAAQALNIPMGLGSQRIVLSDLATARRLFDVRRYAPRAFIMSNLGVSELVEARSSAEALDAAKRVIEVAQSDAIAIHLNVVQELVQPEGGRRFKGALERIHDLTSRLGVPVMVKEVGGGLDAESARKLYECGVKALDIGGRGGTSWPWVESLRAGTERVHGRVGAQFRDFGIPTVEALIEVREAVPGDVAVVATGGIRSGLDVAKVVALGARFAGVGLPLMRAAAQGDRELEEVLEGFTLGLRVAMMGCGAGSLADLSGRLRMDLAHERLCGRNEDGDGSEG